MGKTFVEDERPCDSCVNVTRYGCVSWNCEYINRDEAIKAWREKNERADRKTENSSEKPNNCEHITEDGVTCAKYPACDDCLDNPLNKVKGSKRLLKGSDEPQKKSCATCKHALGNWDGESNNCGRCCGADRRFYEPKDEPQTDNGIGCSRCESRYDCYDRDMPHAVHCNNYGKITDEPQTEREGE